MFLRRLTLLAALTLSLPALAAAPMSTAPDPLPPLSNDVFAAGPGVMVNSFRAPVDITAEACVGLVFENDKHTPLITKVAELNRQSGAASGVGQAIMIGRPGLWVHTVESSKPDKSWIRSNQLCQGTELGYQALTIEAPSPFLTLPWNHATASATAPVVADAKCLEALRDEATKATQAAVLGKDYRGSVPAEAYFEAKRGDVRLVTVVRPANGPAITREAACTADGLVAVEAELAGR